MAKIIFLNGLWKCAYYRPFYPYPFALNKIENCNLSRYL